MADLTPPKRTDGSLYVFRISYHLTGNGLLQEEHLDTDLESAIRYAQHRVTSPRDSEGATAMILIPQGNAKIDAISPSSILYVSAEHVHADLPRAAPPGTKPRAEYSTWKVVRSGHVEDNMIDHSVSDLEGTHVAETDTETTIENPNDALGFYEGYDQAMNNVMGRCEELLKDTPVLNVLRRFVATQRQNIAMPAEHTAGESVDSRPSTE